MCQRLQTLLVVPGNRLIIIIQHLFETDYHIVGFLCGVIIFAFFASQNNFVKINSYESFWNECTCVLQHVIVRLHYHNGEWISVVLRLLSQDNSHGMRQPGHKSL